MKSDGEVMEILEAYDLTGSCRAAAELAGCSHHTVARYVQLRGEGRMPVPGEIVERPKLTDPFLAKIEEWVDRSGGRIRADVAHDKLVALGFDGSARTTRRPRAGSRARRPAGTGRRRAAGRGPSSATTGHQ